MACVANTIKSRTKDGSFMPRLRVQISNAAMPMMVAAMAGSTIWSDTDKPPQTQSASVMAWPTVKQVKMPSNQVKSSQATASRQLDQQK